MNKVDYGLWILGITSLNATTALSVSDYHSGTIPSQTRCIFDTQNTMLCRAGVGGRWRGACAETEDRGYSASGTHLACWISR